MWQSETGTVWKRRINACMRSINTEPTPVAVIPCDKASVAAMQAQIKAAWLAADDSLDMDEMTALTLAAIGITGGSK